MKQPEHRPRISGIVSARNAAAFLGEAIESALHQTYSDFELLVVDDASTDGTADLVAGYARRDPRVRLIPLTEWRGQCVSRNLAMNEARGEWIAILDADDVWLPTHLESHITVLKDNLQTSLITSDFQILHQDGRLLDKRPCPWPEWWLRWRLLFGNALGGHSQVLFRKDLALAGHGYREDRRQAEDYQLWVDLAERGSFAYVPGVQMYYRQHHRAESSMHRDSQLEKECTISFEALRALVQEDWMEERLGRVRNFWLNSLPNAKESLWQTAQDLQRVEDAFWMRHPQWRTPENRKIMAGHLHWHWKRIAGHFQARGLHGKACVAWLLGFGCRLRRLQLRFVTGPKREPDSASHAT